MVITRLVGGLGNQMFQYAAGRALALRLRTELKFDVSGFNVYRDNVNLDFRQYGLGIFNIENDFAREDEVALFADSKARQRNLLLNLLSKITDKGLYNYFNEKHFHYDKSFEKLRRHVYLAGYWNSENYFSVVKDVIRKDFAFKYEPAGQNKALLNVIDSVHSVGIHVRRGDYVTNQKAHKVHGVCDMSYYQSCAELIATKVEQQHCFVFSDDPDWIRDNLVLPLPLTIVDHNGPLDGHEDMRLMSRCKHQIIANSTFSWWAAWLNPNPHKLVLAPKKWFSTDKYSTRSLFPESWLLR